MDADGGKISEIVIVLDGNAQSVPLAGSQETQRSFEENGHRRVTRPGLPQYRGYGCPPSRCTSQPSDDNLEMYFCVPVGSPVRVLVRP